MFHIHSDSDAVIAFSKICFTLIRYQVHYIIMALMVSNANMNSAFTFTDSRRIYSR